MDPAPRPTDSPPPPDDAPPWREVVRRLLVHARCLGASLEEAEDLVHDAVEVLVADPGWLDPSRGSVVTALKAVLRNRWSNRRRSSGVSARAHAKLRLVPPVAATPDQPLTAADARTHRQRFLALLEPDERALFGAWMQQRAGAIRGPEAAAQLGLTYPAYESAKKRLRRRCQRILGELGLAAADLFDPQQGER